MQTSAERDGARGGRIERAYRFAGLSRYTFKERLLIRVADIVFYVLVSVLGRSARYSVEGWEHWEATTRAGGAPILAFWHNRILLATYYFRHRRIVVMTSRSFDGEYIARFIQRFGYGAARGSSTRGGVGALVEMVRLQRAGCPAGFTVDGPRGPRYVAKTGALLLAKKTGQPVLPFTVEPARYIEVKSWDGFRVPLPFTRATVRIGAPLHVPADADDAALEHLRDQLQRALEQLSGSGPEGDRR
ncbi:MAG TPA: lysophospholipid acyltransferase family protein [Pyrinomonadaceae bacterium]|nr:lysophospholipid acyltransferase family protein [Pyrinomonadaceae bacterium]